VVSIINIKLIDSRANKRQEKKTRNGSSHKHLITLVSPFLFVAVAIHSKRRELR